MFVKSPYNYDPDVESFRTGISFVDFPSLAQQQFRDETDINVLVQRFSRTGVPPAPPAPPGVAEFAEVFDFQSAMQRVVDARVAFQALPSKIRSRFHNNPAEYVAFFHDPDNRDEALRLGLIERPPVPPSFSPVSTPEPVVAPPPSADGS